MGPRGTGGTGGTWVEVTLGCFFIGRGNGAGTGGVTPGVAAFPPGCGEKAAMTGFGGAWGGGGAGTGGGGGGNEEVAVPWLVFG